MHYKELIRKGRRFLKMKKNIAILISGLWGGGAERVASILSQYLHQKGYHVYIFTYSINKKKDYLFCGKIINIGDKFIAFNNTGKGGNYIKSFFYQIMQLQKLFVMSKKVYLLKKKYKIDISISFMEELNLINILSRAKDKVFVRICTILSERKEEMKGDFYYNRYLLRILYNKAYKVIVMTKFCERDLINNYGIKNSLIQIIKNPVFINETGETASPIWEHGDKVIITLGRMHEVKQQQHLIRSFSLLQSKYEDAKLLIVGRGTGEQTHYLKKLVKDMGLKGNVLFMGQQQDVAYYLKNSKIFVLTSKTEGFPNSMLEAMACGVPVVSVDCPGAPREILAPRSHYTGDLKKIEYAEYGILVPVLDGNKYKSSERLTFEEIQLEKALDTLLCDISLQEHYKTIAKKEIEKYTADIIGCQWERIF